MLLRLSASVFLSFGGLYPLWLWVNRHDGIDHGFTRFNLGLGAVVLGLGVLLITLVPGGGVGRPWLAVIWLGAAMAATAYAWQRRPWAIAACAVPPAIGVLVLIDGLAGTPAAASGGLAAAAATTVIGGLALAGSMYTMVLGHHYLNAEKMPTRFLGKAIAAYAAVLAVRLVWDAVVIAAGGVTIDGFERPVLDFALSLDGLFVWIALFFGTVLPLVICFLAGAAVRAKSTQAATGLLYVAVSAAIIGEASYRFDLLSYGLAL